MKIDIQKNVLLAPYTSWKVGGPADEFFQPASVEELKVAVAHAEINKRIITLLGGGSNVLVPDDGVRGLVLCFRKLKGLKITEEGYYFKAEAYAGTPKGLLLKAFLARKLEPSLFLAGLPGDCGGGVVMNAGVSEQIKPREFCEIVEWVEVLQDRKIERIPADKIMWSYRHSSGWQPGIITKVGFSVRNEPVENIPERVKLANRSRMAKQPLEMPSCGSVFVNPQGYKAGALIEECGLKGFVIGGAQVSTKHANFIVNTGQASAADIRAVIAWVQKTVKEKKNVNLKTEVVFL